MWEPSAFLPVALLVGLVGVHAAYWRLHRDTASQHQVRLSPFAGDPAARPRTGEFLAFGVNEGGAPRELVGEYAVIQKGETPFQSPAADIGAASPETSGRTRFARSTLQLADKALSQPLVCADDLHLAGQCAFSAPVKVAGDLTVSGRVVFKAPVIVNGYVHVTGEATFQYGLLAKADAVVSGNLVVGGRDLAAWLVARRLRVAGGLALHGSIATTDGVQLGRAA